MENTAGSASPSSAAEDGKKLRECQGCGQRETKDRGFLSCPKCLDLGISPNCFCSQSCFKEAWPRHKAVHEAKRLLLKETQVRGETGSFQQQQQQQGLSPVGYDPSDREAWRRDPHLSAAVAAAAGPVLLLLLV
ncbi:hypothetical protein Emag_000272 [Eimeria magna]